jgi:pentatricopeptide repeat protein
MSLNPRAAGRAAARVAEHGGWDRPFAGLAAATSRIASLGRAGDAAAARAVFDAMPQRDAVAWNAMLTAYTRAGRPSDALALFATAPAPDAFSATAALAAAGDLRFPAAGGQLHARLLRLGLRAPLPVGNALVAMYARCSRAEDAARAFWEMSERNVVSWCSLLHAYVAPGLMREAHKLFDEMPTRSNVAWNTLLMGYSHTGNANQCFVLFNKMRISGLTCDDATLCILVDACTELPHPFTGFAIHKIAAQSGWITIPEVSNSLISLYTKFSLLAGALRIFKSMEIRTIVSWNSLIDAHMKLGYTKQAAALFQSVSETNVISWTAMIGGLARNGRADEALRLFAEMLTHEHIHPDDFTFGVVLHSCATVATLASGKMIHGRVFHTGFAAYLYVANSLIDMYAKCGDVDGASNVFSGIMDKDHISWNTMLFAFAINGSASEALLMYESMKSHDVCPDEATFAVLLTACSHAGLLEKGGNIFESMVSAHGIQPKPEHLACVLDMYARSGNLTKAIEILNCYPETVKKRGSDIHEALLSTCSSGLNVRLRQKIGDAMVASKPARDAGYVMLSNLFCTTGQWDEAERVRRAMAEHGVKKSPGCSWIEVKGSIKVFISGAQDLHHTGVFLCDLIHLLDDEMRNTSMRCDV